MKTFKKKINVTTNIIIMTLANRELLQSLQKEAKMRQLALTEQLN